MTLVQTKDSLNLNLDIGDGKLAQAVKNTTISIYQGANIIYLNYKEAKRLNSWLNEVL